MTTVILFITTVIFALMAFAPGAAPIKTTSTRRAAEVSTEDKIIEVATRFAENLITFNHRTIDRDAERTLEDATQQFASQNQTALSGGTYDQFRAMTKRNESVSTGEVKSAALTSRDDATATVLVVTSQTSDNKDREQRTRLQVIEITLVEGSGGWKVDKIGTPSAA
ncbi:MAG: hypothetical protein WD646_11550 [Actinomycetota bacterium]